MKRTKIPPRPKSVILQSARADVLGRLDVRFQWTPTELRKIVDRVSRKFDLDPQELWEYMDFKKGQSPLW